MFANSSRRPTLSWRTIGTILAVLSSAPLFWNLLQPFPSKDVGSITPSQHPSEIHDTSYNSSHQISHDNVPSIQPRADPVLVMSYSYAVCKGATLWQRVEDAFAGRIPSQGHQFTDQDFANGWTDAPKTSPSNIKDHWKDAFKSFAQNRVPRSDEIRTLNAIQDKSFRIETGALVQTPTKGLYYLNYAPDWSALLVILATSPSNRLNDTRDKVYPTMQPPQDFTDLIPPLNRLSDMLWYWIAKNGNAGAIRYIGHEWIVNDNTQSIFDYLIISKYGRRDPILDWPGLVYNVTSNEGKALLATPNSLSVAWMMIDHAAVLRRRRPRVHIFLGNMGQPCMLWDLAPA